MSSRKFCSTPARSVRSAFTLVELLTVIAIVGILAAILIPVVGRVRKSANNTQCSSNVRQWGQAVLLYAADHKGSYAIYGPYPDAKTATDKATWVSISTSAGRMLYGQYLGNHQIASKIRTCPSYEDPAGDADVVCYSMSRPMLDAKNVAPTEKISLNAIAKPAQFLLLTEIDPTAQGSNPWFIGKAGLKALVDPVFNDPTKQRHGNNLNAVFADGHVDAINSADVELKADVWTRVDGG